MSNSNQFNLSNLSPSNMLAPKGQNDQSSSSNQMTAAFGQQQQQQQQQQQNNHQQQLHFDADHSQRQEALMSLFRSLSSLASSQQQQQQLQNQYQKLHQTSSNLIDTRSSCPVNIVNNTNTNIIQLATQTNHGNASTHAIQSRPVASSSTSTSSLTNATTDSLASSMQSVVAAAVMQQQLVSAALNNQSTPLQVSTPHQQQSLPSHLSPPQQPLPIITQNNQSISSLPFYSEQQFRTGLHFVNTSQQPSFLGLDQNVQYSSMAIDSQQQQQHQQHQQQQRINYCTICNKELCNKYFMKTHMLKMHGINLEMEQTGEINEGVDREDGNSISMGDESVDSKEIRNNIQTKEDERPSSADHGNCSSSSEKQRQQVNGETSQTKKSGSKQLNAMNKHEPTVFQATNNKKSSTGSNSSSTAKQATSVMNGFAGNSMGGVVCDICNKELCSKYFLKVHKQNTHGIMTDYQDASQFVYPFANTMANPNPFIAAAAMSPMSIGTTGVATSGTSLYSATGMYDANNQQQQKKHSSPFDLEHTKKSKKPRLIKDQRLDIPNSKIKVEKVQVGGGNNMTEMMSTDSLPASAKQADNLYRLMITQQQQQQQQQRQREPFSASGQPPIVQQYQPPFMPFDQILANSMGAMMCFGSMSPFGPAGISPTMIVEMILRNQHLFNRNNAQNQQRQQQTSKSGKDKNNNTDPKQKVSAKNSKDSAANDSRYFTHYTEACPMCDRRFKSIKWLKTHIMNDHKQEIGTYMQMMMQHLYANKSQQMGAPFEQAPCIPMNLNIGNQMPHRQQQLQQHQQLQLQQNQTQQPQLPHLQQQQQQQHLLSICSQTVPTSSTDRNSSVIKQQQQHMNSVQDYLAQHKLVLQQGTLLDFSNTSPNSNRNHDSSIDACCAQEGLSANNQSVLHALDDRSSNDQLDLSAKFSEAEHSSDTDINDYTSLLHTAHAHGNRLSNNSFLNNNNSNKNNNVGDDTDGEEDDDCSTKSSFQDEMDQRATNNTLSSGNDLSLTQQIIKTTTTS